MNDEPVRLDPERIGRTLDDIAAIGNRFAGSPGEAACCDYLLGRFGAARCGRASARAVSRIWDSSVPGLELHRRGLRAARARVPPAAVHARATRRPARPSTWAPPGRTTSRGSIAPGSTSPGRIVLAPRIFPFDLCDDADTARDRRVSSTSARRPTPLVGNFTGALYPPPLEPPWTGRPQPYTGVTIGNAGGRALLSAMTCGAPVRSGSRTTGAYAERPRTMWSAEIPGPATGDEHVIVSAHYDSQAEGPCVYDNGTRPGRPARMRPRAGGRAVARRRIVLIASACEEIGVWGATAYVHAHARRARQHAAAMVNLDGLASAYPAAARDLVGRRRDRPDGRADRARAGLDPRPGDERPQYVLRPRAVQRRGRARPA